MPFVEFNVDDYVAKRRKTDPDFKDAWDSSRMEYKILGELIKLRKEKKLSQADIAAKSGYKQQAISRIEKKEHSPTLRTICAYANVLDVDIQLVPRHL